MVDLIETSIISNPTTITETYINTIYTFIRDNRDAFGLPMGTTSFPYLFVTNDLFGKLTGLMQLIDEHMSTISPILSMPQYENLPIDLTLLLIATYEDDANDASNATGFWHSQNVVKAQELLAHMSTQE